jgi:signal transduction histidine kinase
MTVSDNGSGIDEETAQLLRQEELFFKGAGLANEGDRGKMRFGLVLTREFLRIHGGSLEFESVPGQGTTFIFLLPVATGREGKIDSEGTEAGVYESYTGRR